MKHREDGFGSLAVSLVLSSALWTAAPEAAVQAAAGPSLLHLPAALGAAGWAGGRSIVVAQASPTSPSVSAGPLDQSRLSKLLGLPSQFWTDVPINQQVSHSLGLTRGHEMIRLRQLGYREPGGGRLHLFHRLSGDAGFVLAVFLDDGIHLYKIDQTLQLEAAIIKNDDEAPVILRLAQAQKELQSELQFWAKLVDTVIREWGKSR